MFYIITDGGWRRTHDKRSYRLPFLLCICMAGIQLNEHWTQLELIDAIFLGKQSYLCQYFLSLLFLLSLTTSREESVGLISDIYLALIAAGERMHSIEMQVSIRRVDNSSASGNSGIVFINCFCCHCHCPSPTLSELLLFCLPLTHSHPSSSPQFWHEGHIWGWLLLPLLWNIPCVENMSGNVFSLPVCFFSPFLR